MKNVPNWCIIEGAKHVVARLRESPKKPKCSTREREGEMPVDTIAMLYLFLRKAITTLCFFYAILTVLEILAGRKRDKKSCTIAIFLCDAIFGMGLALLFLCQYFQMPIDMSIFLLLIASAMGALMNYEAYKVIKQVEDDQKK